MNELNKLIRSGRRVFWVLVCVFGSIGLLGKVFCLIVFFRWHSS
jgi:hypothetical protein